MNLPRGATLPDPPPGPKGVVPVTLPPGPGYAEIRGLIRERLADGEATHEPELLSAYCVAIAAAAHERPTEFIQAFPEGARDAFEALANDVEANWQDVVELVRLETMRQIVAAVGRGVPLSAATDIVNHILMREFLHPPPLEKPELGLLT